MAGAYYGCVAKQITRALQNIGILTLKGHGDEHRATLKSIYSEVLAFFSALAVAIWTIFTWGNDQKEKINLRREQAVQLAKTSAFEARQPYLKEQLGDFYQNRRGNG